MANKISFSNQHSTLEDIERFHYFNENALRLYFTENNLEFIGFTKQELEANLTENLNNLDRMCVFEILSMLEANFRMDYIIRCQTKQKDTISREFRATYKNNNIRVSLSDDILYLWKITYPEYKTILDKFGQALYYRDWLAHGRYWKPIKFSETGHDYLATFLLAKAILQSIEFIEIN